MSINEIDINQLLDRATPIEQYIVLRLEQVANTVEEIRRGGCNQGHLDRADLANHLKVHQTVCKTILVIVGLAAIGLVIAAKAKGL